MNTDAHTTRPRREAFTLVETVMSVLMVGLLLVGALTLSATTAKSRHTTVAQQDGHLLAQHLMSEILHAAYEDPNQTPTFGLEGGESSSDRTAWDDLDDYNLLTESPPTDRDGVTLTAYKGWSRKASVVYADDVTLAAAGTSIDTGFKRIHVRVMSPTGQSTDLYALRARAGAFDHQKLYGRQFISSMSAALQVGADVNTRLVSGAVLLNEPPNVSQNLLENGQKENGLAAWQGLNCQLEVRSDAHSGASSILLDSRTAIDASCWQDITSKVVSGETYLVEAWAKALTQANHVSISLKVTTVEGGDQIWVTPSVLTSTSDWEKVAGTLTPSWTGTLVEVRWRIFSYPDGETHDFLFDEAMLAVQE